MSKEQVLKDISKLIQDIDKCTGDYTKAMLEQDGPALGTNHIEAGRLLVAAHQELSFLYDYIKEGG